MTHGKLQASESGPGLVVFQFGADLFYANAGRFAEDVRGLIERAPTPVSWLVVDAGAIPTGRKRRLYLTTTVCTCMKRERR